MREAERLEEERLDLYRDEVARDEDGEGDHDTSAWEGEEIPF